MQNIYYFTKRDGKVINKYIKYMKIWICSQLYLKSKKQTLKNNHKFLYFCIWKWIVMNNMDFDGEDDSQRLRFHSVSVKIIRMEKIMIEK